MSKKLSLFLVRHGETFMNHYDRVQGWSDTPLTEKGEQDLLVFAKNTKEIPFLQAYSSDLRRTVVTANLIIEHNHSLQETTVQPMPEFRETFFGSFEGEFNQVVWDLIIEKLGYENFEDLIAGSNSAEIQDTVKLLDPAGHAESYLEVITRLEAGLKAVVEAHQGEEGNILIVLHGNVIRMLLNHLFEMNIDIVENASATILNYENQQFTVEKVNHLYY
ncbi:histidine phosphatase family protein [Isobaculum melis]|uniref:Probable phosphoglycerate mutase n=2 Tax=Isobaculum melis TaxID=142588 RepID=A0A1H9QFH8_9LACT|nr:histidine phosphatase family protein [Isobaculum melis]SER59178.1 probable phosphoglycerate mutase [Isobaculum melis]